MRKVWALLCCALLLVAAWPVRAGEPQGLLVRVGGPAGQPLPGAAVEVYGLGEGAVALLTTGEDGTVRLPYAGRRLWMLRVSARGYRVRESGWIDPAYGGVMSFKLEPWGGDLQVLLRDEAGRPVAGRVLLLAAGGAVVADGEAAGGRLALQELPAGEYRLVASAEGLGPVQRPVTVAAGRVAVERVVLQPRSFAAAGEVVDGVTQQPLPGARVELLRADGVALASGEAGPAGRFRLTAPAGGPGEYRVRVTAPGYAPVETAAREAGPGFTLDFSGAGRIELLPATGAIAGTLLSQSGQPVPNTRVVLLRQGLGEVAAGKSDEDGAFRFEGLAAGESIRYQVVADEALDYSRADWHHLLASDWVLAKPGITVQTPVVARSWIEYPLGLGTVEGRVTTPAGLPVEGATVELFRYTRVQASATTDEDGAFRFARIEASEKDGFGLTPYMLRIRKDGFVATREVKVEGEQRTAFGLPAGARLRVAATLHPDRVVPQGRVTDPQGRPVAGAEVALSVAGQSEVLRATSDAGGWYRLAELPVTLAFASLSVTAPGYLPTTGLEVTAALAEGGRLPTVQLTPRRSTVEGLVVDLTGRPLGGARVRLWAGGAVAAERLSDTDGYYQMEADLTAAGLALLTVEREGYTGAGTVLAKLPGPGERISQPLWLQPETAALSGRVLDQAGRPVSGVAVELLLEGQGVVKRALSGPDGSYRFELPLPHGPAWAWLRAEPTSGSFAGSVSHGLDYAPLLRLGAGEAVVIDLLVGP
ncbi:MAG: MSCRAMM family protein [Bacillota bacterium]